jgi:hypothetical protein
MKYKVRKGQKIKLFSPDKKTELGVGRYIGSEVVGFRGFRFWIPKFKFGRKILRGYQCYWIPQGVAEKIKREALKITTTAQNYTANLQATSNAQ